MEQIAALADCNPRLLSMLTALMYYPDELIGWRAVEALGAATRRITDRDPEKVRVHLRRLFWLMNDKSGAIGWRAPEAIGEILYQCHGRFDEFVSPLFYLLDMAPEDAPRFRAGTLWAIGRIGSVRPGLADPVLEMILCCLKETDSQTRGMAVWCLSRIGFRSPIAEIKELLADVGKVMLYQRGKLVLTSVGVIAACYEAEALVEH